MASWTRVLRGRAVAFPDPLASGRAYALADNGDLLETRDGGASWVKVAAHDANVGAGPSSVVVKDGRRVAMAVRDSRLQQLDLTDGAVALGSDLWWKPSEAGAGLTITQHTSNRPFVVWYTYDATGAPVWRVIPGGTWSDRTLSGAMYETAGPAYFGAAFDPNAVTVRQVGAATLRFDDENNAVFSYSVGGVSGVKPITRQLFAAPAEPFPNLGNLADLWWNASESGWGVAINHQHNRVFATWYVYGADGKPLWVVMPDAVIGPEFAGAVVRAKATGDIYTTRGPAEGAPFDPAQVVPTKIGTATLHFRDSDEATLEYTAFGRTESRTITRQAF